MNRWPPTGACSPRPRPGCRRSSLSSLRSAEHHRSIIEQFGRFPHRNRALNRPSTPEEEQWLKKAGDRFGQ